jgi:hypothetical protein
MPPNSTSHEGPWRFICPSAADTIVLIGPRGRIDAYKPVERSGRRQRSADFRQDVRMCMPQPRRGERDEYLVLPRDR